MTNVDRSRKLVCAVLLLLLVIISAVYLANWRIGKLERVSVGNSPDSPVGVTQIHVLGEDDALSPPKAGGRISSGEEITQVAGDVSLGSEKSDMEDNESAAPDREPWSVTSHGIESIISIDGDSSKIIYTVKNRTAEPQFFQFSMSARGEPMPYAFLRLRNRTTGEVISVDEQRHSSWQSVVTSDEQPPLGSIPPSESLQLRFDPNPSLKYVMSAFCPQCDHLGIDDLDVQFSFDYELMHLGNPDLLNPFREQTMRLANGENVTEEDFDRAVAEQRDSGATQNPKERQVFETDWIPINEFNLELPDES